LKGLTPGEWAFPLPGENLRTLLTGKLTADIDMSDMSDTEPEKLTIQEAARALNVDSRTIYRLIGKGSISKVKEAGRTFVLWSDVKRLLGECRTCQTQDGLNVGHVRPDVRQDVGQFDNNVGHAEIVFDSEIDNEAAHVRTKDTHYIVDRDHYEGLLIRLGQLESEKRYLLEYKEGLEAKDKALEQAKGNISAQAQELDQAKATIMKARNELQRLMEIKQDAEQKAKMVIEQKAKIEAREREIEVLRAENAALKVPWWKRLFSRK
jgi:excisionase family DNA binding protein